MIDIRDILIDLGFSRGQNGLNDILGLESAASIKATGGGSPGSRGSGFGAGADSTILWARAGGERGGAAPRALWWGAELGAEARL
jgi:hypothetical protein